ncbi:MULTISPECIES: molecular chaperone HtpG [Chromobacterium]|uniref:Chaperone protein HtpG n=1 Tax=Chromobacterium rhizoryzae TaxID=1778675 RepID=A0AAD0WAA1_9NEIS|nr:MULTISPECIES: molecular chaperone HtpG [Chromobacterium]AXT47663.1 molecular chaperone HtpG [Chromobacterium rhizoryzae]MDH0341270.1 molecular chaperone HtpG [Chromobacterium haemolyticum]OQS37415.1 molecular chaperone HtpG [Chromobacterium haemolyticum]BBH14130.1 chaperone protein HtpG [Chromobacterium haemolyticum]
MSALKETLGFQTEVKQLLQLMIHSLYSNKEIFLRELISNASDAADKLRFEGLAKPELFENEPELKITIGYDAEARTLTIADNGIGMSRDEVIANIGTIAKSGTKAFFEQLSGDAKKDANLIGQFGVGFYSAFIVADKVTLTTRRAGDAADSATRWESEGAGEYTLEQVEKAGRGTEIVLHLKEGEDELLNDWKLKGIVRKYSDHISIPIEMKKGNSYGENGEVIVSDEMEAVNSASALWTRGKSEISEEQYKEFYKHVAHDFTDPLAWSHARVEGRQEYTELLYIPSRAPFDLFDRERKQGVKLYVRRVFIMEDTEKLMPHYLRFVRGVIDSNDLPLNVSREILQESKDIDAIRNGCVKKVLGLLEDLAANQPEKYAEFWQEFGQVLKEGVGEDMANKERIAKLLRFVSTASEGTEPTVTLSDYVARMKEGQDKIYYITADTLAAAKNSPHLEVFKKKGVEVLLLTDRVDEWVVGSLFEFDGKALQSVAKGALDLGALEDEADKEAQKQVEESAKPVVEKVQKALADRVKEVRATARLTESPACLVAGEHDMSAHLERMLKAAGQKVEASKPTLEINPEHVLVKKLADEADEARASDLAQVLYDQALLAEGGKLEDPAAFVKRINKLMLELSA